MSWKKFGGTHQTEKLTNLNVRGLVADTFSLRQSYQGLLDISGMVNMGEDLNVYGNANIFTDTLFYGNIIANQEMNILGNLVVENAISVDKIYLNDQIVLNNQAISGNLYLGNEGGVPYLRGTSNGLGFNTIIPSSTLDIIGDRPETIKIYTTSGINTNILAQNVNHRGMNITSTDESTTLKIYSDQPMVDPLGDPVDGYDARIQYRAGGVLEINTDRDTRIMSHLSLYNTIVDSEPYLYNVYEDPAIISGNTITVSTVDPSASTFINIGYPVNGTAGLGEDVLVKGGSIGAGAFPGDPNRSFLTMGLTNDMGAYWPTQNIVSGANVAKLRSTVGINTHTPLYDKYIMNVNGPVRIENGEVSDVFHAPFKILATSFSGTFGVAVGTAVVTNVNGLVYSHFVLVTGDGGQTWFQSPIIDADLNATSVNLLGAYAYDTANAIIVGESGFVFYTGDYGKSWHKLTGGLSTKASAVFITDIANIQRVFISYNSTVNGAVSTVVLYFDMDLISIFSTGQDYTVQSPRILTTNALSHIHAMAGSTDMNILYVAGDGGVCSITTILETPVFNNNTILGTGGNTYLSIHVYPYLVNNNTIDYTLAVGPGIITTISNEDAIDSAYDFPSSSFFTGVYIKDASNAIAVGYDTANNNTSILYYTNDRSLTWSSIPYPMLNTSGNGKILDQYPLTTVSVPDVDSFLLTSWDSANRETKLFYCYLPNVLNHANNAVLDVCGNVAISGGVWIQDNVAVDGDETVNGSVYSSHYDARPSDTILSIGTSVQTKTINIGNPDNNNLYGALEASIGNGVISNTVRIGGINDYIIIGGQAQQVTISNMTINNKVLTLNSISGTPLSSTQYPSSAGAGFIVEDVRSGYGSGYFEIAEDFGGFVMKPTLANSNRVKIDVNHLKTTDPSIENGLVVFRRATDEEVDCDFVVYAGTIIDISHIVVNSSCNKQDLQTIGSPFLFNNTVGVKGTVDVSGIVTFGNDNDVTGLRTGAFQVTNGGASITKELYVGGSDSFFYGNISIGQGAFTSGTYPQYGSHATTWGTGALLVYGGASVSGNTYISGNIYGGYDASLNRHLKVGGNTRVYGNLHLNGDASMNSRLYVASDASLNGKLYVVNATTLGGTLGVTGATTLYNTLTVSGTGATTLGGTIDVTGATTLYNTLTVSGTGASLLGGSLTVTGATTLNGTVNVSGTNTFTVGTGATTLGGSLTVAGATILNGTVTVSGTGASSLGGSLGVSGATTLYNTLTVSGAGATELGGTLGVSGATTLNGAVNVSGTNTLTVGTGATTLGGSLTITGATTLNGTVNVSGTNTLTVGTGATTLGGRLDVSGATTLGGSLTITGATTLNGTVNVSGTNTLTVGTGATTLGGRLDVSGATTLGGSLTVTGATTLTGSLSGSQLKGNVLAIYSSSSPFSGGVSDHLYLHVDSGYTYLDSGGGNPFLIRGNTAAGGGDIGTQTYGNIIVAQKNSTSANVMIGKDTITDYNLDVNGTVNATSYNASSDYRIKENVISLNGTYVVDKLRPVEYFNKLLKRQDVGLIAHELQEIYPFLVTGDKDAEDYQSVNYTGLIGILIREVQELKKRVAVLEGNEK